MNDKQYFLVTRKHQIRVAEFMAKFAKDLIDRAIIHDDSKYQDDEQAGYQKAIPELSKYPYGSPEHNEAKKILMESAEIHYKRNSHHPEYYSNGVRDMDLIDLLEMFCDWLAASEREPSGSYEKSIEICSEKYNIPEMLKSVFEVTAKRIKNENKK